MRDHAIKPLRNPRTESGERRRSAQGKDVIRIDVESICIYVAVWLRGHARDTVQVIRSLLAVLVPTVQKYTY
jgi:hypothetical protein